MKTVRFRYFFSFVTLLEREIQRFMRIGVQTLLTPFISNILFLGIFAGLFSGDAAARKEYLSFITPGLIVSAIIFSAYQNPVFSVISMKYQDLLKDFNYYPMSPSGRMAGFILAGAVRGIFVGIMTYLAAAFFAGFSVSNPKLFWTYSFAVSVVFSTAGYLCGLYLTSFESANLIVSMILTPLIYLGGVFYDFSKLPEIVRTVNSFNPLSALITISRYIYSGGGEMPRLHSAVILTVSVLILYVISFRETKKGTGITV